MRCYVFCETLISLFLFWVFSSVSGDSFSEKLILLEFKSSVSDPSGILGSWDFNDAEHHCSWHGVSCDSNSRVSELNIIGGCDGSGGNLQALSFPFYGFGIRKTCLNGGGKLGGRLSPLIGKLTELRVLSLAFNEFSGEIPLEIWGLERLEVLDLEGNSLSGELPDQFVGMRDLRVLNLGFNRIGGEIPVSLSKCVNLEVMSLSGNRINGTIPRFLGGFPKLRGLYLSHNWLVGSIPGEFGQNCWNLEHLDLSGNFIVGKIPGSLGECLLLRTLLLFSNKLDGVIPREFGRLRRLEVLDVSRNSLSGSFPAELGDCYNLSVLVLKNLFEPMPSNRNLRKDSLNAKSDDNNFQGSIPREITSLTKLKILWAPKANLGGELPRNWGSCDSLEMVNLAQNHFSGTMNGVFRACKNLHFLDLSSNKLIGKLDEKLAVPCMVTFDVSENLLSGIIPRFSHRGCPRIDSLDSTLVQTDDPSIAYVSFLTRKTRSVTPLPFSDASLAVIHNFGGNDFTGSIRWLPLARERFGKPIEYAFIAGGNKLVGSFPRALFGKCGNLDGMIVNVRNNKLSGHIPLRVGTMCDSLRYLDASGNQISGSIPGTLRNMRSLVVLDLSGNKLQGKIPPGLHQLKHLKRLALSSNNLTGPIPSDFGLLRSLEMLELSSNSLCGEIPRGLQKLKNLTVLLLDKNKLSGSIPSGLANTVSLSTFDASFNNLSGMISYSGVLEVNLSLRSRFIASRSVLSSDLPDSINGNSQGTAAPVTASDSKTVDDRMGSIEIASITSASAIVSVLLALLFLFFYTRKRVPNSRVQVYESREITIFTDIGVPVTFEKIVQATGSFNASNCIGNGGFGATYKAEISPSTLVAVKRLAVGRFHGVQQFHAEIKTLGSVRHPNLVTLIGYHASESERFLIYNYLPGGNLEDFIKKRSASTIDWKIIHKIALDIARALAYLHDQCAPRVLHRDVKPSNILLDNECNAYLSDFGLSRLLGTAESHATTGVAGTFGYVAPEYAMTCRVSEKSDVYSYGVVLLELISDKKALDPSFSSQGDGFNIVSWACMMLGRGQSKEVFTAGLWETGPHDSLVDMLHLAVMCTVETLSTRPTMKQVAQRLRQIRPMT